MADGYRVLDARLVSALRDDAREFALNVLEGLSERPKRLSSRFFYDERGSQLFERIMDLPTYYPTACEREILEKHTGDILAAVADEPFNLVDLGAGDGRKTQLLLGGALAGERDVTYVPIDISESAMAGLVQRMRADLPKLAIAGLVSEYADGLRWLHTQPDAKRSLVLFLGSNIGNFTKPQARAFLRRLWSALADRDYVLIGFDLRKDIDLLLAAYNDSQGVTAAFNLNLLERMNRELDADFDVERFRHYGTYQVRSGAMESYLVSMEEQVVTIGALNQSFVFHEWEPIHTEYSYKYLRRDIEDLAAATGFTIEATYRDHRGWFVDSLWRVDKQATEPRG